MADSGGSIMSLFVSLGMDTTKFQAAAGNAKAVLGQLGKTAFMAVGGLTALYKVGRFVSDTFRDSINQTVELGAETRNLGRIMGDSAENTSRLIETAKDLEIEYGSLSTALGMAAKKGIDVSVAGLKRLSDQYLALAPGAERAEFLTKTFGRSGLVMGKMMEKGADGIQTMNDAIQDALVLTNESVVATRQYEIAVEALNDRWLAFKVTLGKEVIPVLTDVLDLLANPVNVGMSNNPMIAQASILAERQKAKILDVQRTNMQNLYDTSVGYRALMGNMNITQAEQNRQLDKYTTALENAQVAVQNYNDAQGEFATKQEEVKSSISEQLSSTNGWFYKGSETWHKILQIDDKVYGTEKAIGWERDKAIEKAQYMLAMETQSLGQKKALMKYEERITSIRDQYVPVEDQGLQAIRDKAFDTVNILTQLTKTPWNVDVRMLWKTMYGEAIGTPPTPPAGKPAGEMDIGTGSKYGGVVIPVQNATVEPKNVDIRGAGSKVIEVAPETVTVNPKNVDLSPLGVKLTEQVKGMIIEPTVNVKEIGMQNIEDRANNLNTNVFPEMTSIKTIPVGQTGMEAVLLKAYEIWDIFTSLVNTNWVIKLSSVGGAGLPNGSSSSSSGSPHAFGGSFLIPAGYSENYSLPGGNTASSGEVVTVTPIGGNPAGGNKFYAPVTINAQPGQSASDLFNELRYAT